MKVRRSLLKDAVTVQTFAAATGIGPTYGAAAVVRVYAQAVRRLVRDTEGAERVSELTLTVHPDDADRFTPQSKVTFAGRVSEVITTTPDTFRGYVVNAKVVCT